MSAHPGQEVGAVRLRPVVPNRPLIPLRVRLHEEASERRHELVDRPDFRRPPRRNLRAQRLRPDTAAVPREQKDTLG